MKHRSSLIDDVMNQVNSEAKVVPEKKRDWSFPDMTGIFLALLVGGGLFCIGYQKYSYNKQILNDVDKQCKQMDAYIVRTDKEIKNLMILRDGIRINEERAIRLQAQVEDKILRLK